jgi:hypothetical protein
VDPPDLTQQQGAAGTPGNSAFGLIIAPFLLSWIFSGFLSMHDGGSSAGLLRAVHTFDFPPLASHPWLRTSLIVWVCLCGLAFSLTGVTLAWRRLRISFVTPKGRAFADLQLSRKPLLEPVPSTGCRLFSQHRK